MLGWVLNRNFDNKFEYSVTTQVYPPGEKDPDLKGAPTKKNPGRGNKYHDSVKVNDWQLVF